MSRHTVVAVTGTCVALLLCLVLALQVPAASSLGSRRAKGDDLRRQLLLVTQGASATTATNASTQQRLAATTSKSTRLRRQVRQEGRTVAGLEKQVASLQKDVTALGG